MALVQFYVMKRPRHPITGEIVRGKSSGGTKNIDGSINEGATLWYSASGTTKGANGTLMSVTAPLTDATVGKVNEEPWLLHSVHFSIDDALVSAKQLVSVVGVENTRILKTLGHDITVKLV